MLRILAIPFSTIIHLLAPVKKLANSLCTSLSMYIFATMCIMCNVSSVTVASHRLTLSIVINNSFKVIVKPHLGYE